jgi:hypothetical protein
MYIDLHVKCFYSCPILKKLQFSQQIFEKSSNIKFHENPSSGSRVVPCERTDMTKLIVAFRNFANAPKNVFSVSAFRKYCSLTYHQKTVQQAVYVCGTM